MRFNFRPRSHGAVSSPITELAAECDTVFDPGSQKGVDDLVQATQLQASTTEIAIYCDYNQVVVLAQSAQFTVQRSGISD
jgi:hypothetical protein